MTWELPQSILGFFVACIVLGFWHIKSVQVYEGVLVIVGRRTRRYWGGVSFGSVILLDEIGEARVGNQLFMHEFGHSLQSRASGPVYLIKYGLPSVMSAYGRTEMHYLHPVEQDANSRAHAWFCSQKGFDGWLENRFPRCKTDDRLPLKFWEYLPGIFPFYHLWKVFQFRKVQTDR